MRRLHLFLQIVVLTTGCTILGVDAVAQHFVFNGKHQKDALRFTLARNLVIIPLYINHMGPFNFILDTGVGPMIITDTSLVKSLQLKNMRPIKISGLGKGNEIEAFLTNELSVQVGKSEMINITTAILKEDLFSLSNYVGARIYGLLGHAFFSSFMVELRYSSRRLLFRIPTPGTEPVGEKIPLEIINNKPHAVVEVETPELGKNTLKVVLDNGASHAISLETYKHKSFPIPPNAIEANLGVGLSGPISGSIGRVSMIQLGSFLMSNVIAAYPRYNEELTATFLKNRHGNLGADILSRFNIVFSYATESMYIRRNHNYKKPFEHDMSGIEFFVEETDKKRFFISRIEPDSPAAVAGLTTDDEILSINFIKTSKLNLDDITRTFRSGNGKTIIISINRNGSELIRLIKLKKRI